MPNKENIEDQGQVLAQIGSLLRETREAKGLTLEAAQEETKIRRHYLRALEPVSYTHLDVYKRQR